MGDIMGAFKTKDELVRVLSALWDDIFNTPAITEIISAENLIVKFRFTDFGTDLYVDQYNEIGFSFGYKKAEKDPVTSKIKKYFKYLRAGITYMYSSDDSKGFSINFGYSF